MSLKTKAFSGVKWTTVSTGTVTLVRLGQTAILARFLSPNEFGLMAIMMVVLGFAHAFSDMGISNAIIHRQDITHTQLSSLYWLNVVSGVMLTAIVAGLSPLVALFYKDPRLVQPMLVLSSLFVIVALSNQYRVLCQKELQFNRMAKIEISAALCSMVVAIYCAVLGMGVYALVFAMLTDAAVASGLFLFIGLRDHHRPSLIYRHRELRGFFSFGMYQMGEKSINYISANIDKLLIGKMIGMQAVGFYNMAWQLIIFPVSKINPIVNRVAFPVYARIQNDDQALNRYYAFNVKVLSLVTVPLLAFLFFFSHDVVMLVFGPGWEQTAILVTILAAVGIGRALGSPGGAIILALGKADVGFWWNLSWCFVVVVTLFLTLIFAPVVEAAAYALLGLSLSFGILWHAIVAKTARISYAPIAFHFIKTLLVSFLIAGGTHMLIEQMPFGIPILRIIISFTICTVAYLGYLLLFERTLIAEAKKSFK